MNPLKRDSPIPLLSARPEGTPPRGRRARARRARLYHRAVRLFFADFFAGSASRGGEGAGLSLSARRCPRVLRGEIAGRAAPFDAFDASDEPFARGAVGGFPEPFARAADFSAFFPCLGSGSGSGSGSDSDSDASSLSLIHI